MAQEPKTGRGQGKLFVVATPIGNLGDISVRALEVLGEVALVACEDTRETQKLLAYYGIRKLLVPLHAHNEREASERVLKHLRAGDDVALVTDAGTPVVSDPGAWLVARAHEEGVRVVPLPGPSSVLAAVSASGFPGVPLLFLGFLPRKGTARRQKLAELARWSHTACLFEAPTRLARTLAELAQACGEDRPACVAREMTKLHEEVVRAPLGVLARRFAEGARGEVVIVLGPCQGQEAAPPWREAVARVLALSEAEALAPRKLARLLGAALGVSASEVYAELMRAQGRKG